MASVMAGANIDQARRRTVFLYLTFISVRTRNTRSSRASQISWIRLRTLMVGLTTRVTSRAGPRRADAGRLGRHRAAVRHPLLGGLLESPVRVRRGGRDVDSHVYLFPAAA